MLPNIDHPPPELAPPAGSAGSAGSSLVSSASRRPAAAGPTRVARAPRLTSGRTRSARSRTRADSGLQAGELTEGVGWAGLMGGAWFSGWGPCCGGGREAGGGGGVGAYAL